MEILSKDNQAELVERADFDVVGLDVAEKIAALPAIAALGKNTSWGTDIESRNILFLPR